MKIKTQNCANELKNCKYSQPNSKTVLTNRKIVIQEHFKNALKDYKIF